MTAVYELSADEYRVRGEKAALRLSLAVVVLLVILLTDVTFGTVLIGILLAAVFVKIAQGQLLGSCVRISQQQFPEVYSVAVEAATRLSMVLPDTFIKQDPVINAYALGFFGKPSIVLHS